MPDLPEYMTMVGAVIGAKYRGLWNSAKGTYDGVVTLVTDPEKVLEVASDAILNFMEQPWENTKELAGNIRDSVVDAVWRSTPQEISEDAGEILGDVLTAVATGGGGKAAASGAKIAGNKLLSLGKTGVKEFVEGLGDLGKIGAKNAVYVGATTGIENAAKNSFINRLMMMASEAGDEAKKLAGAVEGATSKVDDIATVAGKTGSVANTVTSTTGELIENAVIGTPIVEGTKNITKEIVEGTTEKTTLQMLEEATDNIATGSKVDDIVEAEMKASSKVDDIAEAGAKASSKADDTVKATGQTTARTVINENSTTNGSGVKISGEKPKTDVGEIKTTKVEGNKLEESVTQTGDVLAQTEIKSNINNATKYELTDRLKLHIEMVDTSVPRKRGIGGAHKRDVFIQNDIKIISETPHPNIDGVSKIEYQMPKRDKTGVPIAGEYQDGIPKLKTVYDSNIISTDEYLRRGLEAANNAASQYENGILPREWVGVDNNGVSWRGYCKNGEITSMYPE